ncbi:hypothetical protein, conserved [Trypanosoma brucei brucei TREU927]|uniref:Cilia- and flagella-associated protein 44 n=1 Tax=Trypanosoma brucei brucei (strain 927/4 GUTat10.1) TaxID=185431 RepID=CFA44_TRYB2|nr:hypothetical protein, conserved [Trypanosoma brucei brucei TREU927]Q57WH1.1 RecName: Full=Cilia- and flagella-associated protein 44; AltName: Full=Component of motile flagella 7 [Trypanosoma brucei brucei TREU927]AAX70050.1 hypothetical protein, conserved [Trypanosoma brucei]AAZ12420.1 hypothetical protein, conserved [Trypanosoma brucei brucei TREU927]
MAAPAQAVVKEKPPIHVYPQAKIGTKIFTHHGIHSMRYNGVCALTGSTVLMASGRFVMFVDVHKGTIESMQGPENGGVGAVAVHPSRQYYVVCERKPSDPAIRAYSWPSRTEVGEFVKGATKGFSACAFNKDGSMMATVGMYPDFFLTVWDWESRGMVLRSKCHNTDVYTVLFSPFDSGLLVSGGAGHIKFWTMANTFTGLKLQGLLGKFGRLEISNVSGFVVLSDGKVISGSESGLIILWEGDLIRCCFAREVDREDDDGTAATFMARSYDYTPCHEGAINVVELMEGGRVLMTAGDDGYFRFWRVSELEVAEGEGAPPLYVPECLGEILVHAGAFIRSVTYCKDVDEWVVLDSAGVLWRVPYVHPDDILNNAVTKPKEQAVPALEFNGGSITSAALSPIDHTVVTGGEDGTIRLVDYVTPRELYKMCLPQPNVVIGLRFFQKDPEKKKFLACCKSGAVLLVKRGSTAFTLLGQWRPHNDGLALFAVDAAEHRLCTIAHGTVFFFTILDDFSSLEPIGFCKIPLPGATCVAWDDASSCCLIGFECGKLLAIRAPTRDMVDQSVSYEFTCNYALVGIRQRKKVEKKQANVSAGEREGFVEEEEEEEYLGPWPVRLICPMADGDFAIGAGGVELLYKYGLHVRYEGQKELPPLPPTGIEPPDYVEEPLMNLCYRDYTPEASSMSYSGRYLVVICEGSQMLLRQLDEMGRVRLEPILVASAHDRLDGPIAAACTSFDDKMLVSVGSDGLVVAQLLDGCIAPQPPSPVAQLQPLRAEEIVEPQLAPFSITEQKDLDDRRRAEDEKRRELNLFLDKLKDVHQKYARLLRENQSLALTHRLSKEEITIHPQIYRELQEEMRQRVEESRKPTALELARENIRTRKMRNRFVDNLAHDRFLVRSFSKEFSVASFRTPYVDGSIKLFQQQIDELLGSERCSSLACDGDRGIVSVASGEASQQSPRNLSLSTAAGVVRWLNSEERKRNEGEQQKMNAAHREAEILTTTMRQYLNKMDERREERHWRKKGYEMLLAHKPDPAVEEASLNEELRRETRRRGECILRTDPSYHSAPSAVIKLQQLIRLEEIIFNMRNNFSNELLKLRDEKERLCGTLNVSLQRIRAINEKLKDKSFHADDVKLTPEEMPGKRFEISRDGLVAFMKQRQEEKLREQTAKKAQRGFGADLATGEPATNTDTSGADTPATRRSEGEDSRKVTISANRDSFGTAAARTRSVRTGTLAASKGGRPFSGGGFAAGAARERMNHELRVKHENIKLTEMEEEELQIERNRLLAERQRLHTQVQAMMDEFDVRLWSMYEERSRVDANLCLAHTHSLLLFREYNILLVFRQKDFELQSSYDEARNSRDRCLREMEELQRLVQDQTASIEKLQEANKVFRREVEIFISNSFPAEHVPYITKVFLRQIKRRKHHSDMSGNDDDITSDDDDDDDMGEDEAWEEICPPNCSEERWCEVIEKREVRLDYVDAITEERRQLEATEQRIEEHKALADKNNAAVSTCLKAIEDFQGEKRKQLNMLETLVAMRCGQVRCLDEEGRCPDTFRRNDLVVVSDKVITGLHDRIRALAEEKHDRRGKLKSMVAEQQALQRERSEKQALHTQWEEKIYEAMLLKFGQIVNLEVLESSCGSREVEQLKERLRLEELSWEKELRKRDKKIAVLREKLHESLEYNTSLLQTIGDQESDRQSVERSLAQSTQKVVSKMYDSINVATEEDRSNLRLLIAAQQEEIDALRTEVALLRTKGGHVYAAAMAAGR